MQTSSKVKNNFCKQTPPDLAFEEQVGKSPNQRKFNKVQIEKKSSSRWGAKGSISTAVTVVLIALIIFGLLIPAVGAAELKPYKGTFKHAAPCCPNPRKYEPVPHFIKPYNSRPQPLFAKEICPKPISQCPSWLPKVMHVGFFNSKNGLCEIMPDKKMPTSENCEKVTAELYKLSKETALQSHNEAMNNPQTRAEKGVQVYGNIKDVDIGSVWLGMDPQKAVHYKKALTFVEKHILGDTDFFYKSESYIRKCLLQINELVNGQKPSKCGKLRTDFSIILDKNIKNVQDMHVRLKKIGGAPQELRTLEEYFIREGLTSGYNPPTIEEFRVLNMVSFVPTLPENLENEFSTFVKEMKIIGQQVQLLKIDPIIAASYVHRLVFIHPFDDGNGRTARILVQAMLQLGGEKAIVFPSNNHYNAAIAADQKFPGSFTNYLEKVIAWNRKQPPLNT